ncbi:hypothetical protein CHUAL_014102 [Chamberlinius hualienensis]
MESPPHLFHQIPGHSINAFMAINRMRQQKQLCDVTIKAGQPETSFLAHKVVLAACSPYFHAMFNDDLEEKTKDSVTIHDVDQMALHLLIDYSYTGEIIITEENVQVLLPAASLLQMTQVIEACCKFLLRQLHPSNCLGIRSFADTHACSDLYIKSHKFALKNFEEVIQREEFLLLPLPEVEELVSSDNLNVSTEEKVFTAVIAWIKHDIEKRAEHAARLMQHVRLPLISRDFLTTHVDNEPLVHDIPECKDFLIEAMKYHLLPEKRAYMLSPRTRERAVEGTSSYLYVVGGGSLFAIHSDCECYNPRTDRWSPIPPLTYRRTRAGVSSLGRLLYVVGGYDGAADISSVESYNPIALKWTSTTSMGTRRSGLDGCIYSVGGFDGGNIQASVERLDPRMSKWMPVPNMLSRRSAGGVAELDGMIYAVGGCDGGSCTASAEKYNPRRSGWEYVAPMQCRRSTHDLVAMDGYLFTLGGNDGNSSLNTVERYDPKLNKWVSVTSMITRRGSLGAAVLNSFNETEL